jgi:fatty acid desaturase
MAWERQTGGRKSISFARWRQRLIAPSVHGTILAGALGLDWWPLSAAWAIGFLVFLPFFFSVRQVLEHRGDMADRRVNYHRVPHGAENRLFGDGLVASTFGGAGFNRHLLHHWEPQVSYTRLKDLERYLMDTELAEALAARRTTYLRTFCRLLTA